MWKKKKHRPKEKPAKSVTEARQRAAEEAQQRADVVGIVPYAEINAVVPPADTGQSLVLNQPAASPSFEDELGTTDRQVELIPLVKKTKKRKVYVDVDVRTVQPQDFILTPEKAPVVLEVQPVFQYEHDARRSVLIELGADRNDSALSGSYRQNLNIYAKVGDKSCVEILAACILGAGTFHLPSAFAKCGVVIGSIALLVLTATLIFLNCRMIELPTLLETAVPGYSGISRACLPRWAHRIIVGLLLLSWYGLTVVRQKDAIVNAARVAMVNIAKQSHLDDERAFDTSYWYVKIIYVFILIPIAWSARLSTVGRCAKVLNRMIVVVALGDLLAAAVFRASWGFNDFMPHAWGGSIADGLHEFAMSFVGIGILPYLISDMSSPEQASKIVNKTLIKLAIFYCILTFGLYLCWGERRLAQSMHPLTQFLVEKTWRKHVYIGCYVVYHVALGITSMLTFPLFFWPLLRELETALGMKNSPALVLQLPWALNKFQSNRKLAEAFVVLSMLAPMLLSTDVFRQLRTFIISVPVSTVHIVFPAWASFLAILQHWEAECYRLARKDQLTFAGKSCWQKMPSRYTRDYFCNSFLIHMLTTLAVSLFLTGAFYTVAIYVGMHLAPW